MRKIKFVPVEFDLKDVLGVSTQEYILLWVVYYRQNCPGDIGWCHDKKQDLANYLDTTHRHIYNLIDRLISDGLLEQHEATKHLRITKKWYDKVILNREEIISKVGNDFQKPGNDFQDPGNDFQPLIINKIKNKRTKADPQLKVELKLPFDSDQFRQAWLDFVEHRKEIKKPMTARAAELKVLSIQKEGWTESQTIEYIYLAIEKGWQDIYKPTYNSGNGKSTPKGNSEDMAARHTIYDQMLRNK